MKSLTIVLLIFCSIGANAQTEGKWSVGVGYTPAIQSGQTFTAYINRHLGEKWQVGLMPFGWLDSYSAPVPSYTSHKSATIGLNFSSRYLPLGHKNFAPYLYSYAGYGSSTSKYENDQIGERVLKGSIMDVSFGIGVETVLFKSNWSVDTNIGYLSIWAFNEGSTSSDFFSVPIFSIGILKRFGK